MTPPANATRIGSTVGTTAGGARQVCPIMQPSIDLAAPPLSPWSSQQSWPEADDCIGQAGPAMAADSPLVSMVNAKRRVNQNRCIVQQ